MVARWFSAPKVARSNRVGVVIFAAPVFLVREPGSWTKEDVAIHKCNGEGKVLQSRKCDAKKPTSKFHPTRNGNYLQ